MTTGTTRQETAGTGADPVAAAAAGPARVPERTAGEATGATDRAGQRRAARPAGRAGSGAGIPLLVRVQKRRALTGRGRRGRRVRRGAVRRPAPGRRRGPMTRS